MFVTQRMAAWGLHCALRALPSLSFLRTSAIMGAGARVGEGGYGVQEQSHILKRFRCGELNLLVSTAGGCKGPGGGWGACLAGGWLAQLL